MVALALNPRPNRNQRWLQALQQAGGLQQAGSMQPYERLQREEGGQAADTPGRTPTLGLRTPGRTGGEAWGWALGEA